jgi:uncharacterized delta-60 repeat protein
LNRRRVSTPIAGACVEMFEPRLFLSGSQIDPTFAANGVFQVDSQVHYARPFSDSVVQPDGKIVAAGQRHSDGSSVAVVYRFNGDGSLDTTFGDHGIVALNDPAVNSFNLAAVALAPDGKIAVAGLEHDAPVGPSRTFIACLLTNGFPDPMFNGSAPRIIPGVTVQDYLRLRRLWLRSSPPYQVKRRRDSRQNFRQ